MNRLFLLLLIALTLSCHSSSDETKRNKEARDDEEKYQEALRMQSQIKNEVVADVQTTPMNAEAEDDSADDPAFWFNDNNPEQSVVYGTNKIGGIYAYDLAGAVLDYYPIGKVNNIDVRQGWIQNNDTLAILGGSNRTHHSMDLFSIDSIGKLTNLFPTPFVIDNAIDDVYGQCMYMPTDTSLYAFINGKNGRVFQYEVLRNEGKFNLQKVDSFQFDSQIEGMVADDEHKTLFVGEEEKGVWAVSLIDGTKTLIAGSLAENNPAIAYDIEGLAIYKKDSIQGFLVASVQGGFNYAVFNREAPYAYMGSFKVVSSPEIDGTEETDGIDIFSYPVGTHFPNGLMMLQDGFNYEGDSLVSQNFKYVELGKIIKLFP